MRNKDIREAVKKQGLFLWQIAAELGVNDGNFSRKLRKELPEQEKAKIYEIIERLSKAVDADA